MTSTFHLLEVSKRGLFSQQTALNTTGHNIANANTEGYTRQRANMHATNAIPVPGMNTDRAPGQLGTGVEVTDLQRLREDYLDQQFRTENKHLGYWTAQSDGLQKIETIMNEPSDTGLQKVMDQFWQSWEDLSQHPDSASTRAVVLQRGIAIQETFSALSTSLHELQSDLNSVVKIKVSDINSIAKQIAQLNKQIGDVVPHGYQPNDLYDKRDLLIDKLSKLTDVKVIPADYGKVNITIEGRELVTGNTSVEMAVTQNPQTGFYNITLDGRSFVPNSGELAGIYEMRGADPYSGVIPEVLKRLDTLAVNLATEINNAHEQGISLNSGGGIPFFVDAVDAASIKVNPQIAENTDYIAAARPNSNSSSSFKGDGNNALEIAKIKYKIISIDNSDGTQAETTTLDDFYRYSIAKIGVQSQEAQRMEKNTELLTGQVDNQRQSVSGVSLDEEMSEMVKFQHAYNAAARVMTSMDEMLDKLINGMGRVGL